MAVEATFMNTTEFEFIYGLKMLYVDLVFKVSRVIKRLLLFILLSLIRRETINIASTQPAT